VAQWQNKHAATRALRVASDSTRIRLLARLHSPLFIAKNGEASCLSRPSRWKLSLSTDRLVFPLSARISLQVPEQGTSSGDRNFRGNSYSSGKTRRPKSSWKLRSELDKDPGKRIRGNSCSGIRSLRNRAAACS